MYLPVNVLTTSYNVFLPFCQRPRRPSAVCPPYMYSPMCSSAVCLACEVYCFALLWDIRCKRSSKISGSILMKLIKAAASSRHQLIVQTKLKATQYPGPGPAQHSLLRSFMYRYFTTFSCHSANVLENLQPSVLRPCTGTGTCKIILVNFILQNSQHALGVHFYRLFSLSHVG